jgi:hypothetical protein
VPTSAPLPSGVHLGPSPGRSRFPAGILLNDEPAILSVRPRLAAFLGVGPSLFVGLAFLGLAFLLASLIPAAGTVGFLSAPNGAEVPEPEFLPSFLLLVGLAAGFGALLWRQIAQPIRLLLAAAGFVLVPLVFIWVYVASGQSAVPTYPPGGNFSEPPTAASMAAYNLWTAFGVAASVAIALAVVVPMVCSLLTWRNTCYAVTGRRIVTTTGMVGRYVRDAPLDRVQDVTTDQGVFGRSLGYGDVVFSTASGSGSWWGLRSGRHGLGVAWLGVPEPLTVRRLALEASEHALRGSPPAARSPAP